ncbi:hypothetical protein AE621_25570 [Acidovorax sp. SD340]|nr:hypothetical protein AE621_25570 [Acidovorax sp. SD340]
MSTAEVRDELGNDPLAANLRLVCLRGFHRGRADAIRTLDFASSLFKQPMRNSKSMPHLSLGV